MTVSGDGASVIGAFLSPSYTDACLLLAHKVHSYCCPPSSIASKVDTRQISNLHLTSRICFCLLPLSAPSPLLPRSFPHSSSSVSSFSLSQHHTSSYRRRRQCCHLFPHRPLLVASSILLLLLSPSPFLQAICSGLLCLSRPPSFLHRPIPVRHVNQRPTHVPA